MGLFSKSKEKDNPDIKDIKSNVSNTSQPKSNEVNFNENKQQNTNNFVNPFSIPDSTSKSPFEMNSGVENSQNVGNGFSGDSSNNSFLKTTSDLTNEEKNLNSNSEVSTSIKNTDVNNNVPTDNTTLKSSSNPNPFQDLEKSVEHNEMNKDEIQEMIDETVEKIIEEKWEKLLSSVNSVVSWKESVEKEVEDLKTSLLSIEESFEKLEKKLFDKISSYDTGLLDVSSEIKALEKVFQKITPTLVNNVNNLEKIAISLKKSTNADVDLNKE